MDYLTVSESNPHCFGLQYKEKDFSNTLFLLCIICLMCPIIVMTISVISEILVQKLNQNAIHFNLKPGVRILVHAAHLTAAPLIDVTPSHSGSAMLMLLSVVFVGLAVFLIYKFKRKIPGINVYAQMQNEKDQEMVSPGSQSESIPNVPQRELMNPQQLVDEKLDTSP